MRPVWGCDCTKQQYQGLPSLEFNMNGSEGKTQQVKMPKEAYMMYREKQGEGYCYLLISPWDFKGLGTESNEYWALGAKFL